MAKANDRVTVNEDGSRTYTLYYPLKSEGETLPSITLRKLQVPDLQAVENVTGGTSRQIALISRLGDVPVPHVKQLEPVDFMALANVADSFFDPPPGTGGS